MTREDFQKQFGIVGDSPAIKEIVVTVMQVAPTSLSVLITGESGTGKEVIAQAIHGFSGRAKNNFVAVNCGAIPETLLESELFGHERGAFTGAHESRKGYFELADNGTIFLDEIGEMPPDTQVKLLRVLESGEYSRVGSAETHRVNVRVIAATNKDLDAAIRRSSFREDLFYRLRAVSIHLPPLRERPEDIPLLFERFAANVAEKHGITFKGVSPDAMHTMQSLPWMGNVRELKNLVETVLVLEGGNVLTEAVLEKYMPRRTANPMLPVQIPYKTPEQAEREIIIRALIELKNEITALKEIMLSEKSTGMVSVGVGTVSQKIPTNGTLREMEKSMIVAALERNRFNRQQTARELGLSEKTLYRRINSLQILRSGDDIVPENKDDTADTDGIH